MSPRERDVELEEGTKSPYISQHKKMDFEGENVNKNKQMPPASVMTRLILIMVWRKLIRNPNTYSSLIGLVWSLISFRYQKHLLNTIVRVEIVENIKDFFIL